MRSSKLTDKIRKPQGKVIDIERTSEYVTDEEGNKWEKSSQSNYQTLKTHTKRDYPTIATATLTGTTNSELQKHSNHTKSKPCSQENQQNRLLVISGQNAN